MKIAFLDDCVDRVRTLDRFSKLAGQDVLVRYETLYEDVLAARLAEAAELTFALILDCMRQVTVEHRALRAGHWQTALGTTLRGRSCPSAAAPSCATVMTPS